MSTTRDESCDSSTEDALCSLASSVGVAVGCHLRVACNGQMIVDWVDPEPWRVRAAPIGLQLHSNDVPQEIHFKDLLIEELPPHGSTLRPFGPPWGPIDPCGRCGACLISGACLIFWAGLPAIWCTHEEQLVKLLRKLRQQLSTCSCLLSKIGLAPLAGE